MRLGLALVPIAVLVLALVAWWPPSPDADPNRPSAVVSSHQPLSDGPPASPPEVELQATTGHGLPAFKVVPVAQLRLAGTSGSKAPFFRGGLRSRAAVSSSSMTAPHIATASPRVALYNSLNKAGETATTNPFSPPDSTGAIGPNNYVEMVNSSIAVYDRSLNLISSKTLDAFENNLGAPYCDPQIQWDPAANRWLFAFLFCNTQTTTQGFLVGWSRTSDPTNLTSGWCTIGIRTDPDLLDFPKLGHNSNYLIVGGNFYNESGAPNSNPPFLTAAIAWIHLPATGSTTCPSTVSVNHTTALPLKNGNGLSNTFTPVPVNTTTSATDGYILSAYDPSGGNGQTPNPQGKLAVWHLDSAGVLHQDADITVNSYDVPFSAPQNGTADVIDTLDARLTQAVGDPTTGIWTQHTVGGASFRSEVDWYEVTFPGTFPIPKEMGAVSSPTDWVFNAAVSPESDAQGAAIVYNRVSGTTLPLIAAQVRRAATPGNTMEPGELILATSSAADTDFTCTAPFGPPCRWGDYSGASPDPAQPNVVWGTNEFNTAAGSTSAWSDENFAVLVAVPPKSPTGIAATAEDNSALVDWTPSAFDAGVPTTTYKLTAYVGASPVATMTVAAPAASAVFTGLTNGVTYTFTVIAINSLGPSPESVHSNAVTPTRAVLPAPSVASSSRQSVNQSAPTPPPPRP
jgi:hypothetical protein